jgi:DNA mismatch repair protein MSH3
MSHPSNVGFKSTLLNNIIFSLPKAKDATQEMLSAVSLDSASEGRKEKLWTDPERYPTIADTELVSFLNDN